jgi:hypothetical protein
MTLLEPIDHIHDFSTGMNYPVYLEVDLTLLNPVFMVGEIIFVTSIRKFNKEDLRLKIGDGVKSYNDLPFVYTMTNEQHQYVKNKDDVNINISVTPAEALKLLSICRKARNDEYHCLDDADVKDAEIISAINKEIETISGIANKIKKSINIKYGQKIMEDV